MFYRKIKEFFLKKIVKKGLLNYKLENSDEKVRTVGVLIDVSEVSLKESFLDKLSKSDVDFESIQILVFKDKIKKNEVVEVPFFTLKSFGITGKVSKGEVQEFINTPFDLLVNFYEESKPALDFVAKKSKAKFKVGFSSVDERINHLMISSTMQNEEEFISEMIKYLRILNKI